MPTRLTVFGATVPETLFSRPRVLATSAICIVVLAFLEWISDLDVSLGVLYVIPVVTAATALNRTQVIAVALGCAWIRDQFHPPLEPIETLLRFVMASIAYGAAGLLVLEVFQNRQRMLAAYVQLRMETGLRRKAEQQLRIMADDSPAGMITIDANARVIGANRAAHEMFGYAEGAMIGVNVSPLLPAFASALRLSETRRLRTAASGWARRAGGVQFPVTTWFSTYGKGWDRCLAAVIVDTSEEVRERERENLEHLRDYNHLLAGAVSHEIRNMCSAISVVSSNLKRFPALESSEDFRALQTLVQGLSEIASFELRNRRMQGESASLRQVLDQLRVVIGSDWADIGGSIDWNIAIDGAIEVQAAGHALTQTFLNLTQNSLRAIEAVEDRRLEVLVSREGPHVCVSFRDSGPGLQHPEDLFHPFRSNADGSGLGLYISRALLKSFGGDLVYVQTEAGCRFDVLLAPVVEAALELGSFADSETFACADPLVHLG